MRFGTHLLRQDGSVFLPVMRERHQGYDARLPVRSPMKSNQPALIPKTRDEGYIPKTSPCRVKLTALINRLRAEAQKETSWTEDNCPKPNNE